MKKFLIIILSMLLLLSFIDLTNIYLNEKPIFVVNTEENSQNKRYIGLFYDTYDCFEEAEIQVKFKWSKYACSNLIKEEF
ncbi:MAG: hypothetical protein IJB71_02640 [Bacilli bacterium]|nr:hypothetical protein [Bacilli bacterium]